MKEEVKDTFIAFTDKLAEAGTLVTQKLIDVAPDVADSILNLVRAKGIFDISFDVILFLMSLSITIILINKWGKVKSFDDEYHSVLYGPEIKIYSLFCVASVAVSVVSFLSIFNFYNFVAAIMPEGAIAMKALSSVGLEL